MIAGGILFMCLFAILALVANGVRNARALQMSKGDPRGSIAALVYYQLSRTNQLAEQGAVDGEFQGRRYSAPYEVFGTNGLWLVSLSVSPAVAGQPELNMQFLVFNSSSQVQGVGGKAAR